MESDGAKSGQVVPTAYDPITDEFETYSAYLDSQISKKDMHYLEDIELARQLVELGIRGNGETIEREEFTQRKQATEKIREEMRNNKQKRLASQGRKLDEFPLLKALQQREEAVRNGKLATIVFIRDFNSKGQEVSGYIDYGHRLKTQTMEDVFDRKKRFLPRPTDLSFYNWNTQTPYENSTPEFQVISESGKGLMFKNKRDRKVLNVDPESNPGENSTRSVIKTDEFLHVVLFDHVTRRRA
eukprot:g8991.t1